MGHILVLDILDTMAAPNADASVAANGVRENIFACQEKEPTARDKREAKCDCENKCFTVSLTKVNFAEAVTACQAMGAELATINNAAEKDQVFNLTKSTTWIGLNDIEVEGSFVWQDGSLPSYTNWKEGEPNGKRGTNCVLWNKKVGWQDNSCQSNFTFVCSMPTADSCPGTKESKAVENSLNARTCIQPKTTSNTTNNPGNKLPGIDVFLNPAQKV